VSSTTTPTSGAESAADSASPAALSPSSPPYREALERVIADMVAPSATQVDRDGTFPAENIQALGAAHLLGLLSATDVGGGGLGLREAADVIERLAGACGSTAMVVLMHYSAVAVLEAHAPREIRQAIAAGRHLMFLHRFEQRRLRLGRCAVDLVGENHVRKHRPAHESQRPAAAGFVLLDHFRARDVRGHQVGRELNTVEAQTQRFGES